MPPRLLQVATTTAPAGDVCAAVQGCGCMGACFTSALGWGAPPCLQTCAADHAMAVALLAVLPYACRVLDFCGNSLKEKVSGSDDDDDDEPRKSKKGKGKDGKKKKKYSRLDKKKESDHLTMKLLLDLDDDSFGDVAETYGWEPGQAYLCGAGRMLFCHVLQPVLYLVLFSFALQGSPQDSLQGSTQDNGLHAVSVACGWCVALREAAYLVATLACAFKKPAFLLINVPATVEDTGKDGPGGLSSGKTFLAAYVSSPQSFVLNVLCSSLEVEEQPRRLALAGSFGLNVFAAAAFGSALAVPSVPLWLKAFYAATAIGGVFAGVAYFEHDDSKTGGIYVALVAVALGGGYAIAGEMIELASAPTAALGAASLGLGYLAFDSSGDNSDNSDESDSGDSGDSGGDSGDSGDSGGSGDEETGYKPFEMVKVFSKSANTWCEGQVQLVDTKAGTVKVKYENNSGQTMEKVLMDNSPDLKRSKSKSKTSKLSSNRSRSNSSIKREIEKKEQEDEFRYQVRAEFKKKGKMGFSFDETDPDDSGDEPVLFVKKISKGTVAADVQHAEVNMILRSYEVQKGSGWKSKEVDLERKRRDEILETIAETRPIRLYFEHPWQYVPPGRKGKKDKWSNWSTGESEKTRPQFLEEVYETMREWMDADELTDDYSSPGGGGLTRTSTSIKYVCEVLDTEEKGSYFNAHTVYALRCVWNGFEGEPVLRWSGAPNCIACLLAH